jgi:hypothetical protein
VGKLLTAQEQLMNAIIGKLGGTPIEAGGGMLGGVTNMINNLTGRGVTNSTNSSLDDLINFANGIDPNLGLSLPSGGGYMNLPNVGAYTGGGYSLPVPSAIPTGAGGVIDFGNLKAPDDYGQYQL